MTDDLTEDLGRIADLLQAIALLLYVRETRRELTSIERETVEGWVLP